MKRKCITVTRIVVFTSSIVFIIVGVLREEHLVVLKKAANLCLECIGIG